MFSLTGLGEIPPGARLEVIIHRRAAAASGCGVNGVNRGALRP